MLKEKERESASKSYIWAYRSGEDSAELIVLLDYQRGADYLYPQTSSMITAAY